MRIVVSGRGSRWCGITKPGGQRHAHKYLFPVGTCRFSPENDRAGGARTFRRHLIAIKSLKPPPAVKLSSMLVLFWMEKCQTQLGSFG